MSMNILRPRTVAMFGLLLTLFAQGCTRPNSTAAEEKASSSTVESKAATPPGHTGAQEHANAAPTPPSAPPAPPAMPEMFAGSHVLVAYKGANRAAPAITRTKEEALALAKKVQVEAAQHPERFAKLAEKYSNCPSAARGGSLGAWPKGRMVPEFDAALEKLKVGEVSGVVETGFGYHVLLRKEAIFAGAHVLIAYKGAMRAATDVTRSKAEALTLAKTVAKEAKADPTKFADLAKKYSNDPAGPTGGSLGKWPRGQMVPEFDAAIEKLKVGEVSDPVETGFGFHVIIRRDPNAVKM